MFKATFKFNLIRSLRNMPVVCPARRKHLLFSGWKVKHMCSICLLQTLAQPKSLSVQKELHSNALQILVLNKGQMPHSTEVLQRKPLRSLTFNIVIQDGDKINISYQRRIISTICFFKNETGQHGRRKNRFVLNVILMTLIKQDLF